ncbi:hypothetical protein [Endozoicomonas sp. 8E]|uniref:hypothetical protein n=1 Tax=Endozoicomonas sp. 8E TaxID=3035692 RepID=UPI0029393679|nr:hypothetical protein [Endozoicomonas sp. 8E]WOG26937.1 hypothetical protein P6910_20665 [Endozoicomonas sp. 8E]
MLLFMLSLSVFCQIEPLTKQFIVELKQNTGSSNQRFSIKPDLNTLLNNPSDIAETYGYEGSGLPSGEKRHKPDSYGFKTTFIESISWQWLCTTNLLVAYRLILTTKGTLLSSKLY